MSKYLKNETVVKLKEFGDDEPKLKIKLGFFHGSPGTVRSFDHVHLIAEIGQSVVRLNMRSAVKLVATIVNALHSEWPKYCDKTSCEAALKSYTIIETS